MKIGEWNLRLETAYRLQGENFSSLNYISQFLLSPLSSSSKGANLFIGL